MASGLAVLYGGDAAEAGALNFTAAIADGLNETAVCRYAADALHLLDGEQRDQYRTLMELDGFAAARGFLTDKYREQIASHAREAEAEFRRSPAGARLSWGAPLDLTKQAEISLSNLGYTHDLVVASYALDQVIIDAAIKRVLFAAGAPLALISGAPDDLRLADATLVLAWKPSAAAKHVVHYGLPLLRRARKVYVVAIEEEFSPNMTPSAQELSDYLVQVHGVATEPCVLRALDTPPLQLADFYREVQADLLLMGAYNHPRLLELLFGGFTKYFVVQRSCNLLLAH